MVTHSSSSYQMKFRTIVLKQLILDCGMVQAAIARKVGCSRPTINLVLNRWGYMPTEFPTFRKAVEKLIEKSELAGVWLQERGYKTQDIWAPLGKGLKWRKDVNHRRRVSRGMKRKPITLGDPEAVELTLEAEMLTAKAMKQFKIFRSPFGDDIDPVKDIYLSGDHRYIQMAMLEAARHSGFLAVIGEVGSGKTMMRRLFVHELRQDENCRIIFPRIIDKTRITAASICDAIIYDLAGHDAKLKGKLEQKSRQVEDLLVARSKSGIKMVMLIEEAQDLAACPRVLKLFKRFHEIEDGAKKVMGIILVGQPELGALLNEGDHYDMREVIRRIQVAEIQGLNGSVKEYIVHKFKRVNIDARSIITDGAIDALGKRLTNNESGRDVSVAYPLTVNNYIIRAMNFAALHGFEKVTDEVVNTI